MYILLVRLGTPFCHQISVEPSDLLAYTRTYLRRHPPRFSWIEAASSIRAEDLIATLGYIPTNSHVNYDASYSEQSNGAIPGNHDAAYGCVQHAPIEVPGI